MYGGQSDTWIGFCPGTLVFPCQYYSTISPYSLVCHQCYSNIAVPGIVKSHTWKVKDSLIHRSEVNEALLISYDQLEILSFTSIFSHHPGWNMTAWRTPWTFLFDGGETQMTGTMGRTSTAIATHHLVRKWNLSVKLTYSISPSRQLAANQSLE
jgi:hypothetical protein